jgi:GxxExxY protein
MELRERGLFVQQQQAIPVYFKDVQVGDYFADLLVENCIVLELKAVSELALEHEAQLINYLKASDVELGLLLNFGRKPQVKRKIYQTARQSHFQRVAKFSDEVSEQS